MRTAKNARARASSSDGRGAIHELGLRWKFDPKQPRIKGKWSGPSDTPAAIQEKATEAFVKVWGPGPEMHAAVKAHLEANPKMTAAAIKAKFIAQGKQVNYTHILAAVKKVKGDQATQLAKEHAEAEKKAEADKAALAKKMAQALAEKVAKEKAEAEAKAKAEAAKPKGFNGTGHVAFGGTEALGMQAKEAGEAAKWFQPGDKVYAFTYTGNKLVPGIVHHVTTEPLPGTGSPVGFVHIQPLTGGPDKIQAYNEMAVAHADVIDSLDKEALKLHAAHSGFKRVQAAFEQAAKQTHLTHNFKKRTDAQLKALDKDELAFHLGQAMKTLAGSDAYTQKVMALVSPPPPFAAKSDHDLELMSTAELVGELVKAQDALGANHPYVKKVQQYVDGKVWHVEEPEAVKAPEPPPAPEPPKAPEPLKYAPGSLDEAVAKHLGNEPNATSARIKELLAQEGHPDTNYSHILAAVKRVKAGTPATTVQGTTGPAQISALVPENVPAPAWSDAPGAEIHPAVEGAQKMQQTFPKGGYYGITEGDKRKQKRKIAADIAQRLTARVGGTYDQQLLNLCLPYIKSTEGQYVKIAADGQLQHVGYKANGFHLLGTPQANDIIRRAGISRLVSGWAATSNDSRPTSLVMQEAAAGELGLTKTAAWASLDAGTKGEMAKLMNDGTYDLCRQVARCMYEATQENLKKNGITHVKLYRGVKAEGLTQAAGMADVKRAKAASAPSQKVASITLRPLSSWAFSSGTAQSFGYGGAVFTATVPANRIFSTAVTGFGCLNEHEVVVLGGEDKVQVLT
jgi:hypothetical protein